MYFILQTKPSDHCAISGAPRIFLWQSRYPPARQRPLENLVSRSSHPHPIHHHLKLTTEIINSLRPSLPPPSLPPDLTSKLRVSTCVRRPKQYPRPSPTQTSCPSTASHAKRYTDHVHLAVCPKLHVAAWRPSVSISWRELALDSATVDLIQLDAALMQHLILKPPNQIQ